MWSGEGGGGGGSGAAPRPPGSAWQQSSLSAANSRPPRGCDVLVVRSSKYRRSREVTAPAHVGGGVGYVARFSARGEMTDFYSVVGREMWRSPLGSVSSASSMCRPSGRCPRCERHSTPLTPSLDGCHAAPPVMPMPLIATLPDHPAPTPGTCVIRTCAAVASSADARRQSFAGGSSMTISGAGGATPTVKCTEARGPRSAPVCAWHISTDKPQFRSSLA